MNRHPLKTRNEKAELAQGVDPMELIGNVDLALHHHMAPGDGAFDFDLDDDK